MTAAIHLPLVALVGRPNVGKSTLFNRLVGRRQALVSDEPGVTRDRLSTEVQLNGHVFEVVDTGGVAFSDADLLLARVRLQTQVAIEAADLVVLVVDARTGLTAADEEMARLLRRAGKPTVVVGNKLDTPGTQPQALGELYALGFDAVFPLSAEHGHGLGELVETVIEATKPPRQGVVEAARSPLTVGPDAPDTAPEADDGAPVNANAAADWTQQPIRVAVVGRPNVGKSSLINRVLGEERLLATDVPGTTRDSVEAVVHRHGQQFELVDTAGIRRRRAIDTKLERVSVLMARRAIQQADVVLVVLDATARPSAQDARIATLADEAGKGVVLVANKWDAPDNPEWRRNFPKALRVDLPFLEYAEIQTVSAKTGRGVNDLFRAIRDAQAARHRRIGTGELNRFFKEVVEHHPPPIQRGHRPRLYYVTQPMVRPPTFIFAATETAYIDTTYVRYLRNALRERYGFQGTPLWIKFRQRGRKKSGK